MENNPYEPQGISHRIDNFSLQFSSILPEHRLTQSSSFQMDYSDNRNIPLHTVLCGNLQGRTDKK